MNFLDEILNLDPDAKSKQIKKGSIIQRAGELNSKAYFVKKGLLRSYTIDSKGKEHIFMFASEGWLISDPQCQEFNHPTELYIDSIENSEIIVFDLSAFNEKFLNKDQLKQHIQKMSKRIGVLQKRVLMLMSHSAKERYHKFLETHPELPNRVPQRMIASYLGITPEALSKIRSEIARSN